MNELKELQTVVLTRPWEDLPGGTVVVVMDPPRAGIVMVEVIEAPSDGDVVRYVPVDALAPSGESGATAAA